MTEEDTIEEALDTADDNKNAKKTKTLAINNFPPDLHKVFSDLAKSRNLTQAELFTLMLNDYLSLGFDFNATEAAIMQEAKTLFPGTYEKRLKKTVLGYAESLINFENNPSNPVDVNNKNSRRAARARAENLIEQMINQNNTASNWYDKIFLTKSSVLDYASKQKQSNPNAIVPGKAVLNCCLERNRERIEQHHAEHKLTPEHNATAYYERRKSTKGVIS